MDNYDVYIHIFPNSKVYIGITSQKPKRRWNNGQGYKNNQYMTNAIMKYGWDNVIHKILYTNLKKEEAEEIEIKLIKEYKADNKRYGYNINKSWLYTSKKCLGIASFYTCILMQNTSTSIQPIYTKGL